ncbi:3'-5' exoribonuclease YhaM family protein [Paenibacillus sabinae]|uniref:Metal dependent phosphohydrolase n=1 Tax=Paenibacillus sabinae T27 TaxID=1268072 RepID=X4ZDR1_9BACL|nr:HD domain-containing protein [Paenibacillus sabinae]AHV95622.1 metal dependent phosphohydrolase [Paenibacillus sabinae T27]
MSVLIKDFKDGDEFVGYYLIKEIEAKQTNNSIPKDFLDIVLADSSGNISAKYWEASKTDIETFFPMCLVKVQGLVQVYREKLQVKVIRIRKTTEQDAVSITDFIRSAPVDANELIPIIEQAIDSLSHNDIKSLVTFCFEKVKDKMQSAPAAKSHHHAYFAGLAYHIVRMLEIGEFICRQRPFLNSDLIKAGIILHDIAKPVEMISEYGMVLDYSNQGKLVGHISMAANWITEAAIILGIDLESNVIMALQHLILSHHNLGEWGSPVQPQLPEAVALHYIDAMDAKLQMVEDMLQTTAESEEWTPVIRGLENKAIYRLKL